MQLTIFKIRKWIIKALKNLLIYKKNIISLKLFVQWIDNNYRGKHAITVMM